MLPFFFFTILVSDGATLLINGGLFSLANGNFADSPIGDALPLKTNKKWILAGNSRTPLAIDGTKNKGVIYYYFPAELTANSEVLFKAKNIPLMLKKQYGKGKIIVFCGTPAGPDTKDAFYRSGCFQEMLTSALR